MARVEVSEDARKLEDLELEFESLAVTKVAGELYDLLCLCLKGDPLILVQGVTSMNGFEAWGGSFAGLIQLHLRGHFRQ